MLLLETLAHQVELCKTVIQQRTTAHILTQQGKHSLASAVAFCSSAVTTEKFTKVSKLKTQ